MREPCYHHGCKPEASHHRWALSLGTEGLLTKPLNPHYSLLKSFVQTGIVGKDSYDSFDAQQIVFLLLLKFDADFLFKTQKKLLLF